MREAPVIDLHTHSNRSDGTLAPAALVERAGSAGIDVLALTDHDTVAGLDEAYGAAAATGLVLVPGVEVSATWRAQTVHVLGLWIDPANPALRQRLESQAEQRRARMVRMCAALDRAGLPGDELLAAVLAQPGLPTRTHLAGALLAGGHVARLDDAFRRYLGRGRAGHVPAGWPALAEVIDWIRQSGGTACLAHPGRYAISAGAKRQMLAEFAAAGGTALEVVTGANGAAHVEASAALAVKHGLAGSSGSDFHGPQQIWNPLGRLAKLPAGVIPVWRAHGL